MLSMSAKFKINNSGSYEYLVHGQNLQIEFHIPYSIFTIINYKELHTRIWFHKSLTGIYYKAPFIRFYNFLINHNFLGFKNRELLPTNFQYPNTSYKYNSNFIPNCFLDNVFKLKPSSGVINTIANHHYPTITFIGIGLGLRIYNKKLNIKLINLKEEKLTIINKVKFPTFSRELLEINQSSQIIRIIPNLISFNKLNSKLKPIQSRITFNKSLISQKLINYTTENK